MNNIPVPLQNCPTRRQWLQSTSCGFGAVALHDLLARDTEASTNPLHPTQPHHAPRAQRVIFLFISGGPSQLDLFDPKPWISRRHGQKITLPVDDVQIRVGINESMAMAPVAPVRPRGECGMLMSDLLPHLSTVADELCLLRGMHTDNRAHAPASLQLHTGMLSDVYPSIGSWISYGLGTENQNLPSFITIQPPADGRSYGASFLPAVHQGTPMKVSSDPNQPPIKYLRDTTGSDASITRERLDFLQGMNDRLLARLEADSQVEAMIQSFELAFRMQRETPELVDLTRESPATLEMYGINGGPTDQNGRACLLARRMSEAGVRFVQVTMRGWDHHGNILTGLPDRCTGSDQPIAGLIKDLRARGLLDDTLIVWSGEFGRTPWSQDITGTSPFEKHGREHQNEGFCAWLAGGGVRPGLVHGKTDDYGFRAVEDTVHLYDLQATVLHLLGLDHEQLTYRHAGRDFRLTDVYGQVVHDILA